MKLNKKWRLLPEFPNYFISEDGEVYSLLTNRLLKHKKHLLNNFYII